MGTANWKLPYPTAGTRNRNWKVVIKSPWKQYLNFCKELKRTGCTYNVAWVDFETHLQVAVEYTTKSSAQLGTPSVAVAKESRASKVNDPLPRNGNTPGASKGLRRPLISTEAILQAVEVDDNLGFCIKCGAEQGGVEPDARKSVCESCGEKGVYGAEELLLHVVA